MTIYGTQAPVASQGLTSNTLISNNSLTLDVISAETLISGNLSVGTAFESMAWVNSMSNVTTHYSTFNYALGNSTATYAVGDDFYDGSITYITKWNAHGSLEWQYQLTWDGAEGVSGTVQSAVLDTFGAGNIFLTGNFYTGTTAAFISELDPVTGELNNPVSGYFYGTNSNHVYGVQITSDNSGNVFVAGYTTGSVQSYSDVTAQAGSGPSLLACSTSVFNGNPPTTASVGAGVWGITNGSLGETVNTVSALNYWQNLSAEYYGSPNGGGAIIFYDGGDSYIDTAADSAWAMGGNWTIQFWSYADVASTGTVLPVISQGPSDSSIDIYYFDGYIGVCNNRLSIAEPTPNTWTFVSVVCNSGTVSVYYNGVSQGDTGLTGISLADGGNVLSLGTRGPTRYGQYFQGFLTNIMVDNSVLYTGNFSPPTNPLAPAGASTLWLLLVLNGSSVLADSSQYNRSAAGGGYGYTGSSPVVGIPGTGAIFTAQFVDGTGYSAVTVQTAGSGYKVNDSLYVPGTEIANGTSPANDLYVTVTGIDGSGGVTTFGKSGTPNYDASITWLYTSATTDYSTGGPWTVLEQQNDNGWVAKLSQNSPPLVNEIGTYYDDSFLSLALDSSGNSYLGGSFYNGSYNQDMMVKLDQDLNTLWSISISPGNSNWTNVAVIPDASGSNVFVVTNPGGGSNPVVSKLDSATGNGIWQSIVGNQIAGIYGGSEGGFLAPNGDVVVSGWAYGPWGSEGMVFSRINGEDGSVTWSTALYTPGHALGGWVWDNPNSSSLLDPNYFAAAGWQELFGGGAEGAMVTKLPLDGRGQGTWGPYEYISTGVSSTVNALSTTSIAFFNEVATDIGTGGEGWIPATVRSDVFEHDGIGNNNGGNISGIGSLIFTDGSVMNTAATGNGIGNLTVIDATIAAAPDSTITINSNLQVSGNVIANINVVSSSVLAANMIADNMIAANSIGYGNAVVVSAYTVYNPATNSLDTYFA